MVLLVNENSKTLPELGSCNDDLLRVSGGSSDVLPRDAWHSSQSTALGRWDSLFTCSRFALEICYEVIPASEMLGRAVT